MTSSPPLPRGERVVLVHPTARHREAFISLAKDSARFHRPWARPPVDAEGYRTLVQNARRDSSDTLLVFRHTDDCLVGYFNLSQIVLGAFRNAYLGYWVGAAFAGHGYMSEGLQLVLRRAFSQLKLHRLEANIQPDNEASIELVRRAAFRLEGFSPRYLKTAGRWRDHERWAITAEDWRAARKKNRGSTQS